MAKKRASKRETVTGNTTVATDATPSIESEPAEEVPATVSDEGPDTTEATSADTAVENTSLPPAADQEEEEELTIHSTASENQEVITFAGSPVDESQIELEPREAAARETIQTTGVLIAVDSEGLYRYSSYADTRLNRAKMHEEMKGQKAHIVRFVNDSM
jgi:hypothetical protein